MATKESATNSPDEEEDEEKKPQCDYADEGEGCEKGATTVSTIAGALTEAQLSCLRASLVQILLLYRRRIEKRFFDAGVKSARAAVRDEVSQELASYFSDYSDQVRAFYEREYRGWLDRWFGTGAYCSDAWPSYIF